MKTLHRGWKRLVASLSREKSDLYDELQLHIEMQTDDNLRAGMPPEEARRQAKLKFGGLDSAKESYRDQRGLPWIDTTLADLRYAARGLRNSPSFTIVAVLTLAVGIGANTAIFSLLDQLLLNPSGISHPERVVTVRTRYAKQNLDFAGSSSSNLADLRAGTNVFEHAALGGNGTLNYTGSNSVPERLISAPVSWGWFDVFGATPLLGRVFTPEEDQPNMNRVAVLSHGAWTRLFGADRDVIGRTVQFDQVPYQVIGVMRPEFRWPLDADVWTPLGLRAELLAPRNRFNEAYTAIARTKPGVSLEQAQAWLGVLTDRIRNADKGGAFARTTSWSITVMPFTDYVAGDNKTPLLLLLGAVGFVLLIACSNIAGLMVARMTVRARELAVRAALGAGRSRLMRQVFSEALLLAAAGGAMGVGLALGGVKVLILMAPPGPASAFNTELDPYVLVFCAVATLASGFLFGLAPAWQISRLDLQGALKIEGRSNTAEGGRQRLRSLLVVGETALALTLLVAAGLFIRSFMNLQHVDPGFDPRGVMTATSVLSSVQYPGGQAQANFYRALLARLRAAPGVTSAGLGWPLPMGPGGEAGSFEIEGRVTNPGDPPAHGERRFITPGYIETLGIPLKRGRYFTDADRIDAEMVTIIDENLAKQYWPGEDPLGKRLRMGNGPWNTIVGIVGHVKHSSLAADPGKGVYYFPLYQRSVPYTVIAVKTTGQPSAMSNAIREAARAADPNHPVTALRSMEEYVSRSLATRRFGMRLLGFFAGIALFLAALGLYGVISYSVTQRSREIGIRMALGAERMSVMKLVVGQGFRLAVIGVAIGVGAAALLGRFLEGQLYQVSASDPLTIFATAAALLAAGLLASYLPARRAVRVDPAVTLRND